MSEVMAMARTVDITGGSYVRQFVVAVKLKSIFRFDLQETQGTLEKTRDIKSV